MTTIHQTSHGIQHKGKLIFSNNNPYVTITFFLYDPFFFYVDISDFRKLPETFRKALLNTAFHITQDNRIVSEVCTFRNIPINISAPVYVHYRIHSDMVRILMVACFYYYVFCVLGFKDYRFQW